jgi:hypothetical protein
MRKFFLTIFGCTCSFLGGFTQQKFRPPAYPLLTSDPYFSIWSFTDTLHADTTRHWTGTPEALTCLLRAGSKTYTVMGSGHPDSPSAIQTSVVVAATQTQYRFSCGSVNLELTFTSPLLPQNLDILSRPVSYISWKVTSHIKITVPVQLYLAAAGSLAVNTPDQQIVWDAVETNMLHAVKLGTAAQQILGKKGDDLRIDWGWLYLAVPREYRSVTTVLQQDTAVAQFTRTGMLQGFDLDTPRAAQERPAQLCTSISLGRLTKAGVSGHILLAYDDGYSIEYFHHWLRPWWRRIPGMTVQKMLDSAATGFTAVYKACHTFDAKLRQEALHTGGPHYADLCSLVYRQAIAAHKLVAGPGGQPLLFNKECFSNGSIGTVDVTYPSSPVFLRYNPLLLEALMEPIFYYSESGLWKKPIAAHDVGTYPIADGQTYPEDMPVEECGNMILLTTAVTRATHSVSFARKHWATLTLWARYLKGQGFDPANQLCTDDFAGHLAHNANLSIKAILALAGYGRMAGLLGDKNTEAGYTALATQDAMQWIRMDEDSGHYSLNFGHHGTWSQKYNLVWDKVLDLHIFPVQVAATEIRYYLTRQNKFGLPLDSRKTYTKSDWILWTATLAEDRKDFLGLTDPVWKYVTETPSRVPVSDWHETLDGKKVGFQARSVVGGYFMPMLYAYWHPLTVRGKAE